MLALVHVPGGSAPLAINGTGAAPLGLERVSDDGAKQHHRARHRGRVVHAIEAPRSAAAVSGARACRKSRSLRHARVANPINGACDTQSAARARRRGRLVSVRQARWSTRSAGAPRLHPGAYRCRRPWRLLPGPRCARYSAGRTETRRHAFGSRLGRSRNDFRNANRDLMGRVATRHTTSDDPGRAAQHGGPGNEPSGRFSRYAKRPRRHRVHQRRVRVPLECCGGQSASARTNCPSIWRRHRTVEDRGRTCTPPVLLPSTQTGW